MNLVRHLLLAAGSFLFGSAATAQRITPAPTLREFSEQRIRHQKTLGLTLGSYALANIAIGAIGASQTVGETKSFHKMNMYWNLVNLGIAGAGFLSSLKQNADQETLSDAVRKQETMKQILLLNVGLDVAYVIGGGYLRERADNHPDKADQLRGYGKSIMLQGGFLFAFDLVNYFIFKNRGDKQERILLGASKNGVGLVMPIR
ncbi:hypothetical protein GCM10028805_18660 [Spirosoma harenae]